MLVVRRTFRDAQGMVPAGSVVEPADITRLKRRLAEGHIVEVTGQNYDEYAFFFKERYGVTLPPLDKPTVAPKAAEASTTEKPKAVASAKPSAKPAAKTTAKKA